MTAVQDERGFADILGDAWDRLKNAYAGNVKLTDYDQATLSGVGSVIRDTVGAAKGLGALVKPPSWDEVQQGLKDASGNPELLPHAILARRMGKPLAEAAKMAPQIPGAIRDINASPDPFGAYLNAAQQTASQGAGAAITALATEGAGRLVSGAADLAANPTTKAVATAPIRAGARAVEATLNSKLRPLMKVMTPADEAAAQAVKVPGRDIGLPPKPTPPANAPVANTTAPQASVLSSIPVRTPAKVGPPTTTLADLQNVAMPKPADVQAAAQRAVGYEPPKPNVPIGQQGLPPGHTPVESSAVRSFRYDPDARTLEVQPTSGATTYRYGDVSPEQAQAFQTGKSVGKAWKDLRDSASPLVAKRVGNKWVNVKPTTPAQATPTASLGDLAAQSVNNVIDSKVMQVLQKQGQEGLTVSMQTLAKDPALSRFTSQQLQESAVRLRNAGKVWGHTARAAGEANESIYGIAKR